MSNLPIDVIPNRSPMCFRWRFIVDSITGQVVQNLEGNLPPSVEGAVANLITMTKQLQKENKELWKRVESLAPKAGNPTAAPAPAKKGRG